jgi:two-component system cell cycle sensor histidine kinase/response regulator CckA
MSSFLNTWLAHMKLAGPEVPAAGDMGVLIVDDEIPMCLYAERVLRRAGYQPVLASSGVEALQKATSMARLDLLVTDLMMPAMNGDRLARTLRQRHVGLKVLYVTGFSDRLFAEKVSLWEGDAFLEKPYSSTALEQALSLLAYGHLVPPAPTTPALWM